MTAKPGMKIASIDMTAQTTTAGKTPTNKVPTKVPVERGKTPINKVPPKEQKN